MGDMGLWSKLKLKRFPVASHSTVNKLMQSLPDNFLYYVFCTARFSFHRNQTLLLSATVFSGAAYFKKSPKTIKLLFYEKEKHVFQL